MTRRENTFIRRLLSLIGLRVYYTCLWGEYSHRYDDIDRMMDRPRHPDMTVAPPWAKLRIGRVRKTGNAIQNVDRGVIEQ